jgi:hypothetical protein
MSQATVTATPATPASAYRPLKYTVQGAGLASLSAISAIRPATGSDVTAIGGDLAEGDILVRHASIIGDLEPEVGGTVYITGNVYAGLWVIAKVPPPGPGGLFNLVITAPDLGEVTTTGSLGVWPEGYTVWCEVSIYTDPAGTPTKVRLRGTPELDGSVSFFVDNVIGPRGAALAVMGMWWVTATAAVSGFGFAAGGVVAVISGFITTGLPALITGLMDLDFQ